MFDNYLNNRFFILYLIPLITGALTVFSYEPFNFTLINFLILPLFFYLIVYIKKKSKSKYRKKPYKINLFIFGSSFGFGFYLSGIYWITNSLTFDENFKILIPFALILIPLFLSLFFSLMVLLVGPFLNFNIFSIFLFSGSLAFSDYLRSKILTGFPWNLWAYSFSWSTEFIQILNKTGLFAFNLICITIFLIPSVIFLNLNIFKKSLIFLITILIIFVFYIYGNYSINQNYKYIEAIDNKFNIKVVSPNFRLDYDLSLKEIENRLKKLSRYSDPTNNLKTLFIWPEGVLSGYSYREILELREIFSKNFGEEHFILFGINKLDEKKNAYYNSLIVVNNRLEILNEYRKQKLVPFGEFLPFENFLNIFGIKKITEGYGSYLRGKNQENIIIEKINILPLICYEIIFTKFIQQSSQKTNLIINISEDGWFGNTIGPHQHFAKAIFRAIEHNTFLIRSTNKGISAIINNKGQVIKRLDIQEAGNINMNVPLFESKNKNKNDLIFFALLFTYIFIFNLNNKKYDQ